LAPAPAAPAPKPVVKLSPDRLERYAGHYRAKDGLVTVLSKRDHLLVGYRKGSPGLDFLPTNEREFFYHAGNDDIAFELDEKGTVTGMRIYPDGKAAGTFEVAPRVEEAGPRA
jgi:hypothetical protein